LAERLPQRRSTKHGTIMLGGSVMACTVGNLSKSGAIIKIENADAVPERFELHIDGEVRQCLAVWRLVNRVGVRFQ
jgi:hypothetical protein